MNLPAWEPHGNASVFIDLHRTAQDSSRSRRGRSQRVADAATVGAVTGAGWNIDPTAFRQRLLSALQAVVDGGELPPELAEVSRRELAEVLQTYLDADAFAAIAEAASGRQHVISLELTSGGRAEQAFGRYLLRLATICEGD